MKDRGELQKTIDNARLEREREREYPAGEARRTITRSRTCMDRITARWRDEKQEMSMNEGIFARIWPLSGRIISAAVQERKG